MICFLAVSYAVNGRTIFLDDCLILFSCRKPIPLFVLVYFIFIGSNVCCGIELTSLALGPGKNIWRQHVLAFWP